MNMEDFQEKMDPTHRASLCRMIRTKQLPECLLTEYLKAKKMVDILDGSLTVGELAIIALTAGYNPDTGKFGLILSKTTEGEDARLQVEAGKTAVKPPALDESDDKVIEEAVEQPEPVDEQTANEQLADEQEAEQQADEQEAEQQAAERPINDPMRPPEPKQPPTPENGKAMLWSPGMPVNVLIEDELKQGRIVGVVSPAEGSGKAVQLTVEFDGGEIETVDENEVEAV